MLTIMFPFSRPWVGQLEHCPLYSDDLLSLWAGRVQRAASPLPLHPHLCAARFHSYTLVHSLT